MRTARDSARFKIEMPPRSKIDLMPKEIRAQLDQRIVEGGFANYRALAKWLNDNGYQIGKNAVHHHGEKLERRLEAVKRATEQARAIAEASPDDEAAMNDTLIRLVQHALAARSGGLSPEAEQQIRNALLDIHV